MSSEQDTTSAAGKAGLIGLIVVRFIVPLWVGTGAAIKLAERSPKLLPEHLREAIASAGVDLHLALAVFIAVEFAAVLAMVLIPRLARPTAVFMLSIFCLVLLIEIFGGNVTSCGCLGSVSPPPWLMLSIDLALLILVTSLPVRQLRYARDRVCTGIATVLAFIIGVLVFARVLGAASDVRIVVSQPDMAESADEVEAPVTLTLPSYYLLDTSDWAGQSVRDIELVSWISDLPADIDNGQQYLILYSKTCEHCHELLLEHFSFDPPAHTTLVAIPEHADRFAEDGLLENPCLDCGELELPVGVDWVMTPPVVIAIDGGVVQCAQEAEDPYEPACLPWHGY